MQMRRPPITLGVLFLAVLVLNTYLLFSVIDAARLIQQVEMQAGHALSCAEFYEHREVNNYFYPHYGWRENVIYLFSLFAPLWLIGSGLLALALSDRWRTRLVLRVLPSILMGTLLLLLVVFLPTAQAIGCATE